MERERERARRGESLSKIAKKSKEMRSNVGVVNAVANEMDAETGKIWAMQYIFFF